MIIEKEFSSEQVNIKKIKPFHVKDVYMSFLLHLNEDFDDDLLLDAI